MNENKVQCPLCLNYYHVLGGTHATRTHGYETMEDFLQDAQLFRHQSHSKDISELRRKIASRLIQEKRINTKQLGKKGTSVLKKWREKITHKDWLQLNEAGRVKAQIYIEEVKKRNKIYICEDCKKVFSKADVNDSRANTRGRRFCSNECYFNYKEEVKCLDCKKIFKARTNVLLKYLCNSCYHKKDNAIDPSRPKFIPNLKSVKLLRMMNEEFKWPRIKIKQTFNISRSYLNNILTYKRYKISNP